MKIMWVNQCKAKSYPSPLLLSCLQFTFFFFKRALSTIWSFRSHRTQVDPAWQRELRTARVRERNSSLLPRGGGEESRALRLIPLQPLHPCSWTAMRGCFTGIAWGQMQNALEGNLPKWITELLLLVSSFSAGAAIYKQGEPSGQGAEGTRKLSMQTVDAFLFSWKLVIKQDNSAARRILFRSVCFCSFQIPKRSDLSKYSYRSNSSKNFRAHKIETLS